MKAKHIHVVTQTEHHGSGSDRSVLAAFTTRVNAERYVATCKQTQEWHNKPGSPFNSAFEYRIDETEVFE